MDGVWIPTKEAARLAEMTRQGLNKACSEGRYESRVLNGRGDREVLLTSLPAQAQQRWLAEHPAEAESLPETVRQALDPAAQFALIRMTATQESIGMDVLADKKKRESLGRDMEIMNRFLKERPPGMKKTEWAMVICDEYEISRPTLYRIINTIRNKGVRGRVRTRRNVNRSAWSQEALDFLQGAYLKGLRSNGASVKLKAYEAACEEAEKRGWRVGSQSSAYAYLADIHPLLSTYASGGRRALDNYFYLARDYSDLKPLQIIVGDQHTFDRWVVPEDGGEPFRMQCFLWLDMATRMPYGIGFAPQYSGDTVAAALRMGLLRFGKFESAYTDNGKPELSNYMAGILNQLRGWNMAGEDLAELYRAKDDSYVLEDEETGEPIGTVSRPEIWRRQRHIKAGVRNAKAKPIERFFRTLEGYMDRRGVPGRVIDKRSSEEEQEVRQNEIDRLKRQGKLLTAGEFIWEVLETLAYYETKTHQSLGMSPREKLMEFVNEGAWEPVFMHQDEVDFCFLARTERTVQKGGRIQIDKELYEAEPMPGVDDMNPLTSLPVKTTVDVRYNRQDPDQMLVILPDTTMRRLVRITTYSMLDGDRLVDGMKWKREQMKKVIDRYHELTKPIPELLRVPQRTRPVISAEHREAKPELSLEHYHEEVEKKVADSIALSKAMNNSGGSVSKGYILSRPVFKRPYDRYKWCMSRMLAGYELGEADQRFSLEYPLTITEEEKDYWKEFERTFSVAGM